MTTDPGVRIGLEAALATPPPILAQARAFGLVCNQASVDHRFHYSHDLLAARFPGRLQALFGPQHGLWSAQQDNMIETGHTRHPRLGVPQWSLYSETRKPTPEMLAGLDLLVVDLQDVGTRVYTYVWTLLLAMEACAEAGIPLLVLDRPNPIGGAVAEGPALDLAFRSFVGLAAIPMRHGLTLAELARLLREEHRIACDLHVQPMQGWSRGTLWPDTGRAWLPPSPNLPRWEGTLVYPGQVLLEGTRLSEGRGTTTPFEVFGAPWLDPHALLDALGGPQAVPGAMLRPVFFEPTFQKWRGQGCGGLFVHVTEPAAFRSYAMTLRLLRTIRTVFAERFAWLPPPYEYETEKMPIDILTGGSQARAWIDDTAATDDALPALAAAPADWWQRVRPFLLY